MSADWHWARLLRSEYCISSVYELSPLGCGSTVTVTETNPCIGVLKCHVFAVGLPMTIGSWGLRRTGKPSRSVHARRAAELEALVIAQLSAVEHEDDEFHVLAIAVLAIEEKTQKHA